MDNKLTNIEIQGFKSIKEMNLSLGSMNVLIGANGAGKSNFIQFLNFVRTIINGRLQRYVLFEGGAETLLHFGSQYTQSIYSKIKFEKSSYEFNLSATKDENLNIVKESIKIGQEEVDLNEKTLFEDLESFENKLESPNNQLGIQRNRFLKESPILREMFLEMNNWRAYHFNDTSDTARVKKSHPIGKNFYLLPRASNLASILYLFREGGSQHKKAFFNKSEEYKHSYHQIVSLIRRVAPFFEDFVLQPTKENPDLIKLYWKHKEQKDIDDYFDANSLSDGTLRFICLAVLLLQPELPPTIIIDEPELGLHPFAIELLGGVLRSVSTQTQIIISTQSPILANCFEPEDIIVVDYKQGVSNFQRQSREGLERWLEDYRMGDIWQKNLIGGNPI